jgi:mono/diheme cytochrome c family protein
MIRSMFGRVALATALCLGAWGCDDDEGDPATDARPADAGGDAAGEVAGDAPPSETAGDVAGDRSDAGDAGEAGEAGDGGNAVVERGKYLVDVVMSCGDCHTPRLPNMMFDTANYLGGHIATAPNCLFKNAAGTECINPRNLTNHETGLKNRTDAEIKAMIREGKRPVASGAVDGGPTEEALHPIMPYYVLRNMTDADADAIVAYLRTVPGKDRSIQRRGASFDIPMPVPPVPVAKIPMPRADYPQAAEAMRGRYLAGQIGVCMECHTQHLPPGSPTVLNEDKLFAGGEDFTGILGPTIPIRSKNITSDMTTGIGTWTVQQLVAALKEGKDKEGKGICPPMPAGMGGYAGLKDQDATDIAHYLLSLAPVVNTVMDMCTFPPPTM